MSGFDRKTPALSRIAHNSNLTVADLADLEHPVNEVSLSGKSAGMGLIIDGSIYVAEGSDPSSPWLRFSEREDSGFGVYTGDDYTLAAPLVITNGNSADLDNNAATVIDEYEPDSGSMLIDNRMVSNEVGGTFTLRVSFTAKASIGNGGFTASVDISPAGDGSITVASHAIRMLRGADVYAQYTTEFSLFTLATFVANGGLVRITAEDGDISIYNVSYYIKK